MKELRLFLLTVGLPAILLMAAGARLVYAEWRFDTREREMRLSRPPPGYGLEVWGFNRPPPPPKPEGERDNDPEEFDPGGERRDPHFAPGGERRDPHFEPGGERRDPYFAPYGGHEPPPEPPSVFRLFSARYGMNGPRDWAIFGCLAGLMLLSLVSGSWLLMRSARKARLEALQQTDFVSNISHEFKTPLTTICLCAELAQDDGLDPARRKKALAAILNESERLKRLVLNALDFSRLEKSRYHYDVRTVDVAEIARETCASFLPRLGSRLHAPEGACKARADADAVRQILANLLDNAAKYAPGSEVEVKVEVEDKRVLVSVADRGPGLKHEELRHVFDRFWRGDNSVTRETGGSGLGLAIARGLARGMEGDLTAANRKDGGAVFTLELKV